MTIKKEIPIEDLVNVLPSSVKYLAEKGIVCIACGEAVWGTLEEAATGKGYVKEEVESIIRDLNKLKDQFDK